MTRTFLPRPANPASTYAVDASAGNFHDADWPLLSEIGANMDVAEAQTEGRVPTPLSRAYMFYTALAGRALQKAGNERPDDGTGGGQGREALRMKARATFRGLCAVFALRDALGLELGVRQVTLSRQDDRFSKLLLDTLHSAPGGPSFWQPMRLFTLRLAGTHAPREILGGLSPLTGLFPAANAPRRSLAGVFWYEAPPEKNEAGVWVDTQGQERPPAATWHDPTALTGPAASVSPQTRTAVRGAIAKWLDAVLDPANRGAFAAAGIHDPGVTLLVGEFTEWARELGRDTAPAVEVRIDALADVSAGQTPLPPFLSLVCKGVRDVVRSDFPSNGGRLYVNRSALLDPRHRLWGREYGHRDLAGKVAGMEKDGDNLGRALGLGDRRIPVPFVFVDRLFTPVFTPIASPGQPLSPEWEALAVANAGQTEYALYPFRKEVLEVLTADELKAAVSARFSQEGFRYLVELRLGEQTITQQYTASGEDGYKIDDRGTRDALDVRLFPNLDLDDPLVDRLFSESTAADRTYFARVRRGPQWDFAVQPFSLETGAHGAAAGDGAAGAPPAIGGEATPGGRRVVLFAPDTPDPRRRSDARAIGQAGTKEVYAPGTAHTFTLDRKPAGLWVEDRGLCFIRLYRPEKAGGVPVKWDLAIDFGTSNTCVAYSPYDASSDTRGTPETLPLPVLTTTLLNKPVYGALVSENEGASAALDFFYKYTEDDQWLLGTGSREAQPTYFPTQFVTTQEDLKEGVAVPFQLSDGLILFRNGNLSGIEFLRLIQGFATERFDEKEQVRPLEKRFRLEQDIKWTRQQWLRAFMAHLRRQVVLAAVRENATIHSITFSYPKAFTFKQKSRFKNVLKNVWGNDMVSELVSESEAVRALLGSAASQSIVYDVGGGTTDVIGFVGMEPTFQTSFKLAAGAVGSYILASPRIRELLLHAVETGGVMGGGGMSGTADLFRKGTDLQILNAWTGLLQSVEQTGARFEDLLSHLIPDGAEAADVRAVQGLLLTVVLLFAGGAFYAGRLQCAAAEGALGAAPFALTRVRFTLTGNGSKLFRLLEPETGAFDRIMTALFKSGLGNVQADVQFDGIYRPKGDARIAPKTTVALGMLLTKKGTASAEIPVANIVGEAFEGGAPLDDLGAFYTRIARDGRTFLMPDEAPAELSAFLDALGTALPRGFVGDVPVVPGLSAGWTDELRGRLYHASRETVRNRLAQNAAEAAADDSADGAGSVTALEPAFIVEIVALIEQIRKEYA